MHGRQSRRAMLAGTAAAGAALAGCLDVVDGETVTRTDERTIDVESGATLAVTNDAGRVRVETADREDVHVRIEREAAPDAIEDLSVEVRREGGPITLVGQVPDVDVEALSDGALERSIALTVTVPTALPVPAISCSVGEVVVRQTTGDLAVDVSVGRVDVQDVDGIVDVSGGVNEVGVSGVAAVDRVSATTGDVTVAVPAIDGTCTIETTTGDITVRVASDVDTTVEASTDVGDVTVGDLPLSSSGGVTGGSASGTLGAGTNALTVTTNVGDVSLERL